MNTEISFDFSIALAGYWEGYKTENEELKHAALRWLRGEFSTKTEAKALLKVSEIINDENWYDYIKLFSKFISMIGYNGFILFIDEGINLYKITNKVNAIQCSNCFISEIMVKDEFIL